MNKTYIHLTGIIVALAGVAALGSGLRPTKTYRPAYTMTEAVSEEVNTSAFASILGEVRTSAADLMWVKTERYMHRGVAFAAHITADELTRDEDGNQDEHEHEHMEAFIPEADEDYRGFIGTIQRAVHPWQGPDAPHSHTPGDQLLPWYRLLTFSDPHHWRGYMIGAWWLCQEQGKNPGALDEAMAFINEGIRNNPKVFQLHLMQGRIRIKQGQIQAAIESCERATELALAIRPEGGVEQPPVWTESDEEDFAAALRYVPFLQLRRLHDAEAARASLARARRLLPNDTPLQNIAQSIDY